MKNPTCSRFNDEILKNTIIPKDTLIERVSLDQGAMFTRVRAEIDNNYTYAEAMIVDGDRWLAELMLLVNAADPEGSVRTQSRLLCAGLGVLGVAAYRALGGVQRADEVGRAGAMLSLLTKIDDQIIDARAFHADRVGLVERTRAFLAPTLASIRAASPITTEPRCALAAALGQSLRDLAADKTRLDRVLDTIAVGWEVQVEAVRVLTCHPAVVSRAEVAAVTRAISGIWLLMIARLSELPREARRSFTAAEEADFHSWGWAIQRADALADLAKDLGDGHLASWPSLLLWEHAPEAYLDAVTRGDVAAINALVRAYGVDRACLPDADEATALEASLPNLGEVRGLLKFIHNYLMCRFNMQPLSLGHNTPPAVAVRLFPSPHPF